MIWELGVSSSTLDLLSSDAICLFAVIIRDLHPPKTTRYPAEGRVHEKQGEKCRDYKFIVLAF